MRAILHSRRPHAARRLGQLAGALFACASSGVSGEPILLHDFRNETCGWREAHAVAELRATSDGLVIHCIGPDPYIIGPEDSALPAGSGMVLTMRLKSSADATAEIFYGREFRAGQSVSMPVDPDGRWHDYSVMLPPLERGARLRFDPAASTGEVTVAWIKIQSVDAFHALDFPKPVPVRVGDHVHRVTAGDLAVVHGLQHWNGFVIQVGGREMAASHGQARIVIAGDGGDETLRLGPAPVRTVIGADGILITHADLIDSEGVHWSMKRSFVPRQSPAAVTVTTTVTADRDRTILHLPLLTLFPGHGTFGERKQQAVLPGVEYLADEPSSSEADVRGNPANRRIVDDFRLTQPMMALVAGDRYLGLGWDRSDHPAPVFDSPDRIFHSGAHLMGLWQPGVGPSRLEGSLDVMQGFTLRAGYPMTLTATLFGGKGSTVVPAMKHRVALLGGLPPVPEFSGGLPAAVRLLAGGWLDSVLHVDGRWRHAVWQDRFGLMAVADAPGYMLWLAEHTDDPALARRLRDGAGHGLAQLPPHDPYTGSCSHVARPFAPLLFGSIEAYAAHRLEHAMQGLTRFDPAGVIRYRQRPDAPDYGSTHWTDHANGLSTKPLEGILEAAAFTGDAVVAARALEVLDKQCALYAGLVPRGAQTWEIPLHTPDILAAAQLVRCCTLAFQLTGDVRYLETAREWAWSGISQVYLDPPTPGPVGLYATTAVLGATNWTAPYWIGLPVQWCGLVYRSALQELAALDPEPGAFWGQLAMGITRSGLQQTFPLDDRRQQGLLPDFFHLKQQRSDGPAISPGTVQANLAEAFGATPIYSLHRLTRAGMLVHAPGAIEDVQETGGRVEAKIVGWPSTPYWLRLVKTGEREPAADLIGGQVLARQFDPARRTLNLRVKGSGILVITPNGNQAGVEDPALRSGAGTLRPE